MVALCILSDHAGIFQTQTLDIKPSHAGVQGFDTAEMLDALQHGVDRSCTFGGVRHRTDFVDMNGLGYAIAGSVG